MKNTEAALNEFSNWLRKEIESREENMYKLEVNFETTSNYTEIADERDTLERVEETFNQMFSIETTDTTDQGGKTDENISN